MEEQEQVVNPEESTTPDEAVSQEVASPEQNAEPEQQSPVPDAGQQSVDNTLDEFGVPWKNRAMEYKRKMEREKEERERFLASQQQVQSQPQKQYSIAELEAFALETDNPAHKQWAINEAEKIREKKYLNILDERDKKSKDEMIRAQTFNTVVQRNPDIVVKDANGQFVGWNQNSPVFKRINQYLQNPDISARPDAWYIAERFAKADLLESQATNVSKTLSNQKNQIKNLQKKTLVEGGGQQELRGVSSLQAAQDKVTQTGDGKDATKYLKEYFKAKGVISDEG